MQPMMSRPLFLALALLGFTGCARNARQKPAPPAPATTPSLALDLATNPPPRPPVIRTNLPSLFVAGDSTAARGAGEAQQGWAVPFADYFDPTKINIINRARGGRHRRTFVTEGLWGQLRANDHAGRLVLVQL